MDSSAGHHRMRLDCCCKDDTVQTLSSLLMAWEKVMSAYFWRFWALKILNGYLQRAHMEGAQNSEEKRNVEK